MVRNGLAAAALMSMACGAKEAPPPSPMPVASTTATTAPAASASVAPTSPSASARVGVTLPEGWWVVQQNTTVERLNQAGFRFDAEGYWVVGEDNRQDRRLCRWEGSGSTWRCHAELAFTLTRKGDRLEMDLARGEVGLAPATDAQAEALEARVATTPIPDEVCERAEACCIAAFELMGATCDPKEQLADKTSTRICQRALIGIRRLLTEAKLPFPDSCHEP